MQTLTIKKFVLLLSLVLFVIAGNGCSASDYTYLSSSISEDREISSSWTDTTEEAYYPNIKSNEDPIDNISHIANLTDGAIRSMIFESIDRSELLVNTYSSAVEPPYSERYSEAQLEQMRESINKHNARLGVLISIRDSLPEREMTAAEITSIVQSIERGLAEAWPK